MSNKHTELLPLTVQFSLDALAGYHEDSVEMLRHVKTVESELKNTQDKPSKAELEAVIVAKDKILKTIMNGLDIEEVSTGEWRVIKLVQKHLNDALDLTPSTLRDKSAKLDALVGTELEAVDAKSATTENKTDKSAKLEALVGAVEKLTGWELSTGAMSKDMEAVKQALAAYQGGEGS